MALFQHQWSLGAWVAMLVFASLPVTAIGSANGVGTVKYDASIATEWFELERLLVEQTPGYAPPVAARAFAYTGITLYEAVVPGMPAHQSLVGQLNGLVNLPQTRQGETYHWPVVANSALANVLRAFFATARSENLAMIDALEQKFMSAFAAQLDPSTLKNSAAHGLALANAILEWSLNDGGHEGYLMNFDRDYQLPITLGGWVPTPRPNGPPFPAMLPYWGENRPFVLTSGAECGPSAPLMYSEDPTSAFYAEALEVYQTVRNLTPAQREIALYWADEPGRTATPAGHWMAILTQILKDGEFTLDFAAEAYAKLGITAADAFIACWHTKYQYNLLRPISYIQKVIDASWNVTGTATPVVSPSFPEYTSGHSVQSSAAAFVLSELLGDNFTFRDTTHHSLGFASRSYNSFTEAAMEAALSRLYGGIHYRSAIEAGMLQGRCVGQRVSALQFRKLE